MAMNQEGAIALEASGISKSFPGVLALDDVSLRLRRGRVMAVLGENGAGKSTLMNVMAGVMPPDRGTLRVEGREVRFAHTWEARAAGIVMIFQELNLVPDLTVAENIFLGREPRNRFGWVDFAEMNRAASRLLRRMELAVAPTLPVGRLRVGQQQIVEIAKALSLEARVLIMDEPTSALSEHETDLLFRIIGQLKERGVAMAYITHKLEELDRVADDAVVLRDGRRVGEAPWAELTRDRVVRWMVGRDLSGLYQRRPGAAGAEVLRVRGLSLRHSQRVGDYLLRDVDLEVRSGEVLGLYGLMGAGRTELLETLFGMHAGAAGGRVEMGGRAVVLRSPAEAIAHGLVLAPEDRKREGLFLQLSVAENASLASLRRITHWGWLHGASEQRLVQSCLERFRVKTPSWHQCIANLSGGNQQKVILGKWLATRPAVLLLDEPTRGIDVQAKREVYELLEELTAEGLAVVLASSELPEILAVADRVLVLCEGRKRAEFGRGEATEEAVMRAALPRKREAAWS